MVSQGAALAVERPVRVTLNVRQPALTALERRPMTAQLESRRRYIDSITTRTGTGVGPDMVEGGVTASRAVLIV